MEKDELGGLPQYSDVVRPWHNKPRRRRIARFVAAACLIYFGVSAWRIASNTETSPSLLSVTKLQEDYATCAALRRVPRDPSGPREYNERWVNGTKPLLIRNATVWTGEPAAGTSDEDARLGKGYSWTTSDVLVDHGIIQKVGHPISLNSLPEGTQIYDAESRQLTSGIVDMHSHAGLGSLANLQGDENELSADITPYVRSLDSLDPLHPEFQWIKSGGVTTSLLLPGSGNNIGGEAFVVKLAVGKESGREEISGRDLLADPEHNWRYIKMACGENPKRVYGRVGEKGPFSRMGESWELRHAFDQARNVIKSQDDWCSTADAVGVENMKTYLPQELQWETLSAVLRGQVLVNTHCYTIPDLEAFVDHTNEFKFRVRAFHHAHQTYLVPEILKRAWGGAPAAALFADNMYYKVEAYTASEQAGKVLYENGLTPVYVSDNPVLNSQHVKFEAAKAYANGLPYHVALAGVTSAPAQLLGLGERIGKIKPGFDADIVVWDSDPLSVGAAPVQVWIDGASQFKDPVVLKKPATSPIKPDAGLSDVKDKMVSPRNVIFTGISNVHIPGVEQSSALNKTIVISDGVIICAGVCEAEVAVASAAEYEVIDLNNGYLTKPFTAFGSSLGLEEIAAEGDTQDGEVNDSVWVRAVDGLLFDTKQVKTAHAHGVVKAITPPQGSRGVSAGFKTGAKHSLEEGAVFADEVSVHYDLTLEAKDDKTPSVSGVIGALRRGLLEAISSNETIKDSYSEKAFLKKVVTGELPLVLKVHSADTIATIIKLTSEIENAGATPNVIIIGAAESHLVANEIAEAGIAVVVAPLLAYSQTWDQRRSLTGAPLTNGTAIDHLLDAGVVVAIGVNEVWETRDLRFAAGIAYKNGGGRLSEKEALDLISGNIYEALGLKTDVRNEFVVYEGSPLEIDAKLRAVGRGGDAVDVWV
ncbi:amidohydrolase [Delphinella strobiligena]|nr:amidohydrolase [Delphinella strobiligena]